MNGDARIGVGNEPELSRTGETVPRASLFVERTLISPPDTASRRRSKLTLRCDHVGPAVANRRNGRATVDRTVYHVVDRPRFSARFEPTSPRTAWKTKKHDCHCIA